MWNRRSFDLMTVYHSANDFFVCAADQFKISFLSVFSHLSLFSCTCCILSCCNKWVSPVCDFIQEQSVCLQFTSSSRGFLFIMTMFPPETWWGQLGLSHTSPFGFWKCGTKWLAWTRRDISAGNDTKQSTISQKPSLSSSIWQATTT